MLKIIIPVAVIVLACLVLFVAHRRNSPKAHAAAAVADGRYQFIALTDKDGKTTYPQVEGIPDWYFQTTGIMLLSVRPETLEAQTVYMKAYNDALYDELKKQGKFHEIEENIAFVRKNLDNYESSKTNK